MNPTDVKIFETDMAQVSYSFLTTSMQQLCATESFCALSEIEPIHMNNVMEARIEEVKGKLDAAVVQDCFLVYSLNVQTVLRKVFIVCPLVADTGRLKNSMK